VAVTAVRSDGARWDRAPVGPHIAFAAHGVEVSLPSLAPRAGTAATPRRWSGTSFAAPVVTAALATLPAESGRVQALAARTRDLGAPGRDPVFGWGKVEARVDCPGTTRMVAGN
jgi:hypothetical protein